MIRTALVHQRENLTLEALHETVARSVAADTELGTFQLPERDQARMWQSPQGEVVSAVHVAGALPVSFRLPVEGEAREFQESCRFLAESAREEWAALVHASGLVFVEPGRSAGVHWRSKDMTVYAIPVLPLTRPEVQQTIWRVAAALDALVLGEEGQLIWRPGEADWSEPSLRGGRQPIARKRE